MASFVDTHAHAGDERDFEALYETYKSDVQRLASYLLKNATDAEDAAQTVFLNVLRALRQGVTPSDPRAWLLAITRNVCFSRRRAAAARPAYVELGPEVPQEPSEEETPSADEIVGALARLLPNQRTALILRDFRGVSRTEICDLMALSPAAVEALLTRARAAFREELQAGGQPFECAETRALVEQQLDGLITVADRHSLRSHLRHCAPCSTLARAVRSSRSKVAGLLFWPVELVSRLVDAFSQAPSALHVAAGLTSAAAVTTAVAIPVAVSTSPAVHHRAARQVSPAAAAAVAAPAPDRTQHAAAVTQSVSRVETRAADRPAARARPAAHARPHRLAVPRSAAKSPAQPGATAKTVASAPVTHTTTSMGTTTTDMPATGASRTGEPTAGTYIGRPIGTAGQSAPAPVAVHSSSGIVTPPDSAKSSRSSSPVLRAPAKSKGSGRAKPKAKPAVKKPSRRGGGRRTAPPLIMPASTPPVADLPPADDSSDDGAVNGVVFGPSATPAAMRQSSSAGADSGKSGNGTTGRSAEFH